MISPTMALFVVIVEAKLKTCSYFWRNIIIYNYLHNYIVSFHTVKNWESLQLKVNTIIVWFNK